MTATTTTSDSKGRIVHPLPVVKGQTRLRGILRAEHLERIRPLGGAVLAVGLKKDALSRDVWGALVPSPRWPRYQYGVCIDESMKELLAPL